MNKEGQEKLEKLVDGIVDIEKETMHKKFDVRSGKGVQFARAKADADAVNGILNLVDKLIGEE
jgi:hypothetical protein